MTPRSLFNIILKVLGILFIKDILATVPSLFSVILYFSRDASGEGIWTLLLTLLTLAIYGLVSYYLIFKSDMIFAKLNLDKGFDQETIPLNIHRSTVLSIAIIVIGGLMIADGIPDLCRYLFSYLQERRMTYGQTSPTISYALMYAAKIVVGFLLVNYQRPIVNYIEYRRKR